MRVSAIADLCGWQKRQHGSSSSRLGDSEFAVCNKLEEAFSARLMWSLSCSLRLLAGTCTSNRRSLWMADRSGGAAAAAAAAAVTQSSPSVTTTNIEIIQGCCAHCSARCFQVLGVPVKADEHRPSIPCRPVGLRAIQGFTCLLGLFLGSHIHGPAGWGGGIAHGAISFRSRSCS